MTHDCRVDAGNLGESRNSSVITTTTMQTRSRSSKSPQGSDEDSRVPQSSIRPPKNAVWSVEEEKVLIASLLERTGGNSLKDVDFNRAVNALAPLHEKGAAKTVNSCKNKWNAVCISFVCISPYPDFL